MSHSSLVSLCDLRVDVGLAEHEQLLAVVWVFDLVSAVLAVVDLVALLDIKRDAFAGIVQPAVANGEDLALLRLLLGGVGSPPPRPPARSGDRPGA